MHKELNEQLQEEIKKYNAKQNDKSEHITTQDILSEIASDDQEELRKAIELLKAKTENDL